MRIANVVMLVVGFAGWVIEGLTNWSWPIGQIGTAIIILAGLIWYGRKAEKNPLSSEEYEAEYIQRQVKKYKDGDIVG